MTVEQDDESRAAALKAAREMIKHLKAAYPHRTKDSIKRTCFHWVEHALDHDEIEISETWGARNEAMRTNLITHLHCSKCGRLLNVEYDKEDSPRKIEKMEKDEPTGAACRHNRILVEPCRNCIDAATGPAKQLASAIKAMSET